MENGTLNLPQSEWVTASNKFVPGVRNPWPHIFFVYKQTTREREKHFIVAFTANTIQQNIVVLCSDQEGTFSFQIVAFFITFAVFISFYRSTSHIQFNWGNHLWGRTDTKNKTVVTVKHRHSSSQTYEVANTRKAAYLKWLNSVLSPFDNQPFQFLAIS